MRCFNLILVALIGGLATETAAGFPIPGPDLIEVTDASGNILTINGQPMSAILYSGNGYAWDTNFLAPPSLPNDFSPVSMTEAESGSFGTLSGTVSVGYWGLGPPYTWYWSVGLITASPNTNVTCQSSLFPASRPCVPITTTLQDVSSFLFPSEITPPFHVWVAEVSEPSTAALVVVGLGVLSVVQRQRRCGRSSAQLRPSPARGFHLGRGARERRREERINDTPRCARMKGHAQRFAAPELGTIRFASKARPESGQRGANVSPRRCALASNSALPLSGFHWPAQVTHPRVSTGAQP